MNRVKEHCADSRNECPVIRFIEDILQVKLLPYQKSLVTHVFETNECKRINLCSDCRTKMEKKMEETINRQAAIDAVNRLSLGETDATRLAMRIWDYLERLPSAQPTFDARDTQYNLPIGTDLISRAQAIAMCRKPCMRNADCSDFEMEIMLLPSAQPEIIRCKDCKHYKYGICKKAGLCVNKSPNGFCDWGERREEGET